MIGQLSDGKYLKTPLESKNVVTFFAEKGRSKNSEKYEYLLDEKKYTDILYQIFRYCLCTC
jgi:hypothetical protein